MARVQVKIGYKCVSTLSWAGLYITRVYIVCVCTLLWAGAVYKCVCTFSWAGAVYKCVCMLSWAGTVYNQSLYKCVCTLPRAGAVYKCVCTLPWAGAAEQGSRAGWRWGLEPAILRPVSPRPSLSASLRLLSSSSPELSTVAHSWINKMSKTSA